MALSSEQKLDRELQLAGILRAGNAAEVWCKRNSIRNIEIRVIEEIVSFGAKLQLGRLR